MKKRKHIKRLVLCFISLVTLAALISIQHVYADGTEVQLVIHKKKMLDFQVKGSKTQGRKWQSLMTIKD